MNLLKPRIISRIKEPADSVTGAGIGTGIRITWDDGTVSELGSGLLRRRCPCADCEELRAKRKTKAGLLRVVTSDVAQQTNIVEIKLVGDYAISILWGDGHSTGIYTFDYLKSLTEFIKI